MRKAGDVMAKWQGYIQGPEDLYTQMTVSGAYVGGHAVGIIAVDLVYPKLPGNVVNATTFDFPVIYKKVSFEISGRMIPKAPFAARDSTASTPWM